MTVRQAIPLLIQEGNGGYDGTHDLLTLSLTGPPSVSGPPQLAALRSIEPITRSAATDIQMDVTLVQVDARNIGYRINNAPAQKGLTIPATIGETQIWAINNETQWSHPFHLHGFFFQVLDDNGEPLSGRLRGKDTVDVLYKKTVRLAVRYDDRPGATSMWMFHCHILDHAEGGLMGMVELGVHHMSDL